jgi:hypothetical protein
MLRFTHRNLRNIHKFWLFSNKSFLLLKLKRRENWTQSFHRFL